MTKPKIDAPVSDVAPDVETLTDYDRLHLITYLRLLDAEKDGADWREVSRLVLKIDPDVDPVRAQSIFDSHLARARWMTQSGYRHLLTKGNLG